MSQTSLLTPTGVIFVVALREFFATHKLAQDYRWSPDPNKTSLDIVEQWPIEPRKFPLIVVDTLYTGADTFYMSHGAQKIRDANSDEYLGDYKSGIDSLEVRFTINDYSKTSVDELADLFIFFTKREMEKSVWDKSLFNVQPQRGLRSAGAGARPFTDQQLLYFVTLSQPVKTTWYDEVLYPQKILAYLTTAERSKIWTGAGTDTIQFQADNT